MPILTESIRLQIVKTEDLGLHEANVGTSPSVDNYPINRQLFSFREDNLEIKCCVGVFFNMKSNQYFVQIFLKKFKSNNHKLLSTDSELFLKCSFDGFGTYYCAISNSHLTNFFIHRKFSKDGDFVDATFEVIPFLPFKLDLNFQLIPLLAISHSPVIPSLRYYDTEWPCASYIRQILASRDGTIVCPSQVIDQKSDSVIFSIANINESECKNTMMNQIFGVTKSVCEELGSKYQAVYGIPEVVYTDQSKIQLNSDTDFLIYSLPPKYQLEIPTIISDGFADLNPFHLCSIIRKEVDNDFYFLTIYSPSLNLFYTVADNNISSINSKPRCYSDEYIISALYIRLNVLSLFRTFSLSPRFNPRFNKVTVYEVEKILYLTDLCDEIGEEGLRLSVPKERGTARADDLDDESGIAIFPYDPDQIFPSIPLTCTSTHSVLKLQIRPEIKKFQLIWFCHDDFKTYFPVIVDLTNDNCIKIPKIGKNFSYDLIHMSSNYLTKPYNIEDSLPTGPMILFKCKCDKRNMKACSLAFGKRVASNSLNQFMQPPVYFYTDRFSFPEKLQPVIKARGINKYNCYIRTYIKGTKTLWMKLPDEEAKINTFINEKFPLYRNDNFIQFFIEIL